MEFILEQSEYGYMEIIISRNCEWDDYYLYTEKLRSILQINYTKELNDFDSFYLDFEFKNHVMTIGYNTFLGVNIYPEKGTYASSADNEMVKTLYGFLRTKLSTFVD